MQGDIIDVILSSTNERCQVLDPFVGSGTIMTEALIRGLDFTGIDINPLAVLVCEAKAAIDLGSDIEAAAQTVLRALRFDTKETIDVEFPGRSKWFSDESAEYLSRIRRAILRVKDGGPRKVMWAIFAETIRLCSNSRTSTYKLHVRPESDRIDAERVRTVFEANLNQTMLRVKEYRQIITERPKKRPSIQLICEDVREAKLRYSRKHHQVLVTSPPYGDNRTTIPYGQFSYLALHWIPSIDLQGTRRTGLLANTHALDTASLGGSLQDARAKTETMRSLSSSFDGFASKAEKQKKDDHVRKVGVFMADFFDALSHVRASLSGSAHWVLTTGNRTAGGIQVPFDSICREMLCHLGGKPVSSLQRRLPTKRMPSRNSMGDMITTETTLVVEFA